MTTHTLFALHRKQALCAAGFSLLALLLTGGCSDGGDTNGDDGGGGDTSSGGTASGGATASGGTSSTGGGASGGANGSGGGTSGAHCTPGEKRNALFLYPDPIQNCGFTGSGELEGVDAYFRTIKLEAPIGPGDTFAFSVEDESAEGTMELWGTNEECGPAQEKLATSAMGTGTFCMEASPENGTYTYLVWVRYAGGEHGDVTFCPSGSCGTP